jgi:hypothetical protein
MKINKIAIVNSVKICKTPNIDPNPKTFLTLKSLFELLKFPTFQSAQKTNEPGVEPLKMLWLFKNKLSRFAKNKYLQ